MKGRIFCIPLIFFILVFPGFSISYDMKQGIGNYNHCLFDGWNRTYGGASDDRGYSIVKAENGYFLGGLTFSFGNGNGDAYLIRVDENGNELWEKTYGGAEEDGIYDLLKIENGCMIIGKTKSFGHGGYDAWLIKVDENGNEIWNKTYGGALGDYIYSIEDMESGYVMAGTKMSTHMDYDAYLIRVDGNGNELWEKTYGGEGDEIAADVSPTDDGYVISGNLLIFEEKISDAFLIKVDEEGNEIWNKTYGGKYMDTFNSVMAVNDGYVAAGFYGLLSQRGGAWIVKIDEDGDILWNKTIGGKTGDDYAWTFIKKGEEYIMVGSSTTYSKGGYDIWLIKVSQPKLEIEIQGGIGITVLIKNVGNETISNLEFSMKISGFVFFGKAMEGEISSLPPGTEIKIQAFVMGFGESTIKVRGGEIYKTADCFILGPFVFLEE